MKITLTGKVNEVLITLTDKSLIVDKVSICSVYDLSPQTTLSQILELIETDLKRYNEIPQKEINKVRKQVKQFNFR